MREHTLQAMPYKGEIHKNDMTNFGILMEIRGIEKPFDWSRELVSKVQRHCIVGGEGYGSKKAIGRFQNKYKAGLYWSPSYKDKSLTSEGEWVKAHYIGEEGLQEVRDAFKGYFKYIEDFIEDMKKVFPTLKDDWGIYVPEVKYLSPEPLVNYRDLSLTTYPNVHFVGDALSARGITVSGAQGTLVAEQILRLDDDIKEFLAYADQEGPWDEEDDKIYTVGGLTNDKKGSFMKFINKQK